MPQVRVRCRYCDPDDPLARGFCATHTDVLDGLMLTLAECHEEVLRALMAEVTAWNEASVGVKYAV